MRFIYLILIAVFFSLSTAKATTLFSASWQAIQAILKDERVWNVYKGPIVSISQIESGSEGLRYLFVIDDQIVITEKRRHRSGRMMDMVVGHKSEMRGFEVRVKWVETDKDHPGRGEWVVGAISPVTITENQSLQPQNQPGDVAKWMGTCPYLLSK